MTLDHAVPLVAVDDVRATRGPAGELVVTATKRIEALDPYLPGHYPGRPIYPGVFVIETVYQAARQAVAQWSDSAPVALTAVRSARFSAALLPGDVLVARCVVFPAGASGELLVKARCQRDDGTAAATVVLELAGQGNRANPDGPR